MTKKTFFVTANVRPGTDLRDLAGKIQLAMVSAQGLLDPNVISGIRVGCARPEFPEPGLESTEEYRGLWKKLQELELDKETALANQNFGRAASLRDAADAIKRILRRAMEEEYGPP